MSKTLTCVIVVMNHCECSYHVKYSYSRFWKKGRHILTARKRYILYVELHTLKVTVKSRGPYILMSFLYGFFIFLKLFCPKYARTIYHWILNNLQNQSNLLKLIHSFMTNIHTHDKHFNAIIDSVIGRSCSSRVSWIKLRPGQTRDIEIGICCSPPITQQKRVRKGTGWFGIIIMCPSGAIYPPVVS